MKCDICKKPISELIIILPLRQPDGKLDTLACEKCATKSKAYCAKHVRPHIGFIDGSTACIWCVDDLVTANKGNAVRIRDRIWAELLEDEIEDLNEAAEISAEITGCSDSVAILRFIASAAIRSGKSIEEIVREITTSHSIASILWK